MGVGDSPFSRYYAHRVFKANDQEPFLMRIASVASAFPEHYYKQEALTEALKTDWRHRLPNTAILDRLDESMQVEGRYLVEPIEYYWNLTSWGQANDTWIKHALDLGEKALCKAIHGAGLKARDLSAIFVTSVTGIAAPSLDARLANRIGLSPNIKRIPIFGLGCVAGAAGISRAADYVKAYPDQAAALLSVELCSLTLQREDLSMAHLISALLFGDGAAATVVVGANRKADGPEILATKSILYPHTERVMGWDISEKGFKIVLSPEVPKTVTDHLGKDVDVFLGDLGHKRTDIHSWIMHTGGPKVLESTAEALGITATDLAASWECLRKVGNISSTSVLLVLEDVFKNRRPAPGSLSILAAMGPGFCAELLLLRW
jgi:alkylresorcinol/alkylpyrone synthase